ncbi:hypothetical protein [Mycobacterium sp. 1164985.4]|nr:hypothetical protein [Mycobacterium sp. 1164985.4]
MTAQATQLARGQGRHGVPTAGDAVIVDSMPTRPVARRHEFR